MPITAHEQLTTAHEQLTTAHELLTTAHELLTTAHEQLWARLHTFIIVPLKYICLNICVQGQSWTCANMHY